MSFEGRYQKLCPDGHYEEQCVYMETKKCSLCGKAWRRSNLVDDTNEPGEGFNHAMKKAQEVADKYQYSLPYTRQDIIAIFQEGYLQALEDVLKLASGEVINESLQRVVLAEDIEGLKK